jgi:outer membrane receptor protein involved in Fe transport
VNYTDGYNDRIGTNPDIPSWTTVDAMIRWTPKASSPALSGLEAALSVDNVLNTSPPRYTAGTTIGLNYDPANSNPYGRVFSLRLSKRW